MSARPLSNAMQSSLFDNTDATYQPLAARMRPRNLMEYVGQQHLLAEGKPLRKALDEGRLHSMILWGPPGTGKTTLANMLAERANAQMVKISAVLAGVKDIREIVDKAKERRAMHSQATILFVDEVHRFNKSQQDAFLPHVEDGTITLIGATTENPSFELNNALLSRARVYVLRSLTSDDIKTILQQALDDETRGVGQVPVDFAPALLSQLAEFVDGDGRAALNLLEVIIELADNGSETITVTQDHLKEALGSGYRRFDKSGDHFYDQISALHKSVRGSAPDAALYWYCRMLDGGCDPLYIARRVVRMATEDIGNADPRGLTLALNAWDVQERLGSPEGELAIAQAIVYLACAAKSNAIEVAFNAATAYVKSSKSHPVPMHLCNAPTRLLKELGHGKDYRYAHNEPHAYAAGEQYFPDAMQPQQFYQPTCRGLEKKIAEKLAWLRQLDEEVSV